METDEHELPVAGGRGARETRIARVREAAARLDTQPAFLAAARRLRRRLPGDKNFGDPLSTAGPAVVQAAARGVTALQPERESFVQELGLAGLQLWQSMSEAFGRGRASRIWRCCSRTWSGSPRGRSRPATPQHSRY